jgi:Lrp/AsnC family transcriptional regulator, leucine-responsive regulatory protein
MTLKEEISFQPDASDLKLLELLQKNAKTGVKELAAQLNLTYTPTYERIRKLEQYGYITGYHAHIDRSRLGKKLIVYTHVSLKAHTQEQLDDFEQTVMALPEVISGAHISGEYDYILQIQIEDVERYREFIVGKLSRIEHISKLHSNFVLKMIKDEE